MGDAVHHDATAAESGDAAADLGTGPDASEPGCPANQHMCAGVCFANDDPATCGASCTPCRTPSGGGATCTDQVCGGTCPTGKQLCMGDCVDVGPACGGGCPAGRHECGALCPSTMDENACGTSCTPCPVPAGASRATCDGVKCGFVCMPGFHVCGASCARDDAPTACGNSCTACPAVPNGAAICNAGTCGIQCNAGYHACNGRCVSDALVTSCGASCTPCPAPEGGTATCTQGACGGTCPATQTLCDGVCIPANTPCSNTCPTGSHSCGGICADNRSTNSCGTAACTACPVPAGANGATCDGAKCDFTCRPGFHRCGAGCAADSDAAACGAACTACPVDPNGTAICQDGACATMCKTGFHRCGSTCVDNRLVANCGSSSCTPCVAPTGGTATCNGVSCVAACPAGRQLCAGACVPTTQSCNGLCPPGSHDCNGSCLSNTITASCGSRCTACPAPASNGTATCDGTSCGIACATGFKVCPGTTNCVANNACCTACTGSTPVCQNGTCVKRPNGQDCNVNTECASGICADGVCCATLCGGQCEACDSAASKGTCVAVTTPRTPCAGTGMCVGACNGTLRTACTLPDSSKICRSQTCSGITKSSAGVCNGAGACGPSTTTTCSSDCGNNNDCATCQNLGSGLCCPAGQGTTEDWTDATISAPWSIYRGTPNTVPADETLALYLDDRVQSTVPTLGFISTLTVDFSQFGNNTFAFDFGDANASRLFPALRMVQEGGQGTLRPGGARPDNVTHVSTGTWGAFGAFTGLDGVAGATSATATVYIKSNAVAMKVVIGARTFKSGFVTMNTRAYHLANYSTIDAATSGIAMVRKVYTCQRLSDAAVDARYSD